MPCRSVIQGALLKMDIPTSIFAEHLSPHEISRRLSLSRREFLRGATGAVLGSALTSASPYVYGEKAQQKRKIIVITFGGGARDQETFAPEGQENIPHLLNELAPQSSFFTHVTNHGILGHYVATASLATGVYETLNNFAAVPGSPYCFRVFSKGFAAPFIRCMGRCACNGFNRIGESGYRSYGYGAAVILPKHLLQAATSGSGLNLDHLLRDNYEDPLFTPVLKGSDLELDQLDRILRLSVDDFTSHARTLSSPDELSVYIAKRLMRQESPSLLWITMHDMDIAHSGAYSLYIEGIRRTDRLCAEIWKAVQSEPEYKNNTTLFILPDFGRDADYDAGGNGFQHHRTGDAASRTTWMMALGKGVREGVIYDQPIQSIDLVPSLGAIMGFSPQLAEGKPIKEFL